MDKKTGVAGKIIGLLMGQAKRCEEGGATHDVFCVKRKALQSTGCANV